MIVDTGTALFLLIAIPLVGLLLMALAARAIGEIPVAGPYLSPAGEKSLRTDDLMRMLTIPVRWIVGLCIGIVPAYLLWQVYFDRAEFYEARIENGRLVLADGGAVRYAYSEDALLNIAGLLSATGVAPGLDTLPFGKDRKAAAKLIRRAAAAGGEGDVDSDLLGVGAVLVNSTGEPLYYVRAYYLNGHRINYQTRAELMDLDKDRLAELEARTERTAQTIEPGAASVIRTGMGFVTGCHVAAPGALQGGPEGPEFYARLSERPSEIC